MTSGGGAVWHRKTRGNGWLRANEWIGGPDGGFCTILEEIAIKKQSEQIADNKSNFERKLRHFGSVL